LPAAARLPHRPFSKATALLVGPDHQLERPPRDVLRFLQRAHHLDPTDRADVAVEVPAVRHRVDVRAEQQRRQRVLAPARRARMLPAASMRGSRPAARISSIT
jgi:hypothetical protein